MATFNGTAGNDSIAGTSHDDVIYAGDGNNTVNSGAGNDSVYAGSGNDHVEGGAGDDLLSGGGGDDVMSGGADNDILLGGDGNDVLSGDTGDDIISGGAGADTFQYGKVVGGFGHDTITDLNFGEGDRINLFAGAAGNLKNITITSFADIQNLHNLGVSVTITDAGHGAVLLDFGSFGSIKLMNVSPADVGIAPTQPIVANATGTSGNDILNAGPQDSHIVSGDGNDIALAGSGASNMEGNGGTDTLVGGAGDDTLGGQTGNDTLLGNDGNDVLGGGPGDDTLTGGAGADTFKFQANFGHDTITDLNFGEGDSISFVGADSLGTAKITDLAELKAFIAADPTASVTADAHGLTTVNFDATHSITLVGFSVADLT